MYTIERADGKITIRTLNNAAIYIASEDSLLIYQGKDGPETAKVKDLSDTQLLLALVKAIEIKDFVHPE